MLKKTYHIWYYILTLFLTNYLASFILYVGVTLLNKQLVTRYWKILALPIAILALIAGSALIWYSIRSFLIHWKTRKFLMANSDKESKELDLKFSNKTITPTALIGIGFTTTIVEFSTAAPFIAYLTVVQQFQPTLSQLVVLLFIYNLIFSWPLFALYFLFVGFQSTFEKIYKKLNYALRLISAFLIPVLFFIIALLLLIYTVNTFLGL
ncbi:GAP family protein [Carnobacterium jeotgali]|uniref:GAP family protein n=1 Tax=Carnobacterium jeotgali TaxID=545534 RepID=UPI003C759882